MEHKYTLLFNDMVKYMKWRDDLSDEENKLNGEKYFKAVSELCRSKDVDVLEKLLEFFNGENEEYGGVCEDLKSQIGINFTLDQLMQAFYKKFDYLVKNDLEMSYEMSSWFLYSDMFHEFREMFNTVKSADSNVFIDRLDKWCGDEFPDEIALLREDMKKW